MTSGNTFVLAEHRPDADRADPGRHHQATRRRSFAVNARRLHLLSVLRAEVHLLQLRFRRFPARAGTRLHRRARAPRSPDTIVWPGTPETVYLGGGTPSRMDPAPIWIASSARSPDARGAKRPSKPRPAASRLNARRPGPAPASIASASACSRSSSANSSAPAASTPPRLSPQKSQCSASAGSPNINIDLIAGLPGQTRESWRESLDWIERLAPPHVSVYMLEVDEDSRLGSEVLLQRPTLWRAGGPERRPDRRVLRNRRRAAGAPGHPPLRNLQLRPPRLRIAAQLEVLAARAVRRLRRRRAFLR